MKILISLIIGVLCFTQISAQEYYYYYKGEKIYLELNPDYIFISGTDKKDIQNVQLNISVKNSGANEITKDILSQKLLKPTGFVEQHPVRYCQEINITDNLSPTSYQRKIEQLRQSNNHLIVSPYFQNESIDKIGLSNYFRVKLKHQDDFDILLEQIAKHNVELVGYNKFMPLWFTLSVRPNTPNALQMANTFHETDLFQHATPSLKVDALLRAEESPSKTNFVPNDTYYTDQWYLNNTGQYGGIAGIDIQAECAWDIALGDNVTVAVIDHGFEMDHPDLINNNLGVGYDALTGTSPSQVYGVHGTLCAGVLGATGNNNEGISGVAPEADLISISHPLFTIFGSDPSQELADGINWAWQNKADVISNSWFTMPDPIVEDAINDALTQGRNGLGAIVVFAGGNDDEELVKFPANSNPDVLAVGAMSPCGERKNTNYCDGETSWGSSYGDELDLVAPGVLVSTTDRQGSVGGNCFFGDYNPCISDQFPSYVDYDNYDYTKHFGGTSSACPMVAGVAALMLSVNPSLTVQEVNDIIEQSAQKVRTDLYTYQNTGGRPNGTWNNEMGYGLLDACAAVVLAQECTADLTLSGTINSNTYQVSNAINATGNICPNQSVTFDAGNAICLNNVFIADSGNGSTFLAHIDGCESMNRTAPRNNVKENEVITYSMERLSTSLSEQVNTRNYPDPFTGTTTIEFTLREDSPVTLSVSDLSGRQIAILLNGQEKIAGTHQVIFNGNSHPSGMYYYTIQAGAYVGTQKMTLVK